MRSRRTFAAIVALVAAATLAWFMRGHGDGRAPASLASGSGSDATSSAPAGASASPSPDRLAAVERVVAERNERAQADRKAFEADGWTIVKTEPPDQRVLELDPSLIAEGREQDLRYQLASTTPQRGSAHRVAQIILLSKDEATQEAAALALGRIKGPEAQEEAIALVTGGKLAPEDLARRHLIGGLMPKDLDDDAAARMASLLDSEKLTPAEKEQVAFTLGLVSLRDGMELPDEVLASLSPDAIALMKKMKALGTRSFLAHAHASRDPRHQ